ncbi:ABC transporter permease [Verrucomicrobiales bacterium]|nr:ABC transporter permease [Verrucomicrobiales bacterium]MDC0276177.1 ABC transporter permease [Verrucomicrobiales bacterium]
MAKSDEIQTPDGLTPFSERFGAVFVKELRQGLRAKQFVFPFVAVQLIAVGSVAIELAVSNQAGDVIGADVFGGIFFFLLNIVFGFAMPMTLFGALQPELQSGRNVELLLMSNLTRWQIVRGKWIVGSVLAGLMLVSLIPYALTRYYLGGVGVVESILMIAVLGVGNAVSNGIVIGASGFRNIIVRVIIIGVCAISCSITTSICVLPVLGFSGSGGGPSVWEMTLGVILGAITSALFVVYGLQLGRAQLRLYENPLDPPSSGLIIALIIFTPIIVGVTMISTHALGPFSIVGGVVGTIGLICLALVIDRGPGKNSNIRYSQP